MNSRTETKSLFQKSFFVFGGFLPLPFASVFLPFVVAFFLYFLLLLQRERHRKQDNQKNKRAEKQHTKDKKKRNKENTKKLRVLN